jgi:hypothetical protein
MDDEKYMLRKSAKGFLVKLDADIFYQLLEYNFRIHYGRGLPLTVYFWKKGVQFSVEMPSSLSRFIMKAKKGEIIDHINRNILDNRRINMRFVNIRQNRINYTRRNRKTPFYGVFTEHAGKSHYWRAQYVNPAGKQSTFGFKLSVMGFFLAAVAHDKMIIENNEEDYAPLNFQMFKIPAFKKVLLATDIKLLRSIYLGQKNKNIRKTAEKSKPEKKNTVYKNQFFFDFRR